MQNILPTNSYLLLQKNPLYSEQAFYTSMQIHRTGQIWFRLSCSFFLAVPVEGKKRLANSVTVFLFASTRLYKSLCRKVRRSVTRSVHLSHIILFFCVLKQLEGRKTKGLTGTVTCKVAYTRFIATNLVFF